MRARSAASSASEATGIVNGRIAVAPVDVSIVADMWAPFSVGSTHATKPARLLFAPRQWQTLGLLPGLVTGLHPGVALPEISDT